MRISILAGLVIVFVFFSCSSRDTSNDADKKLQIAINSHKIDDIDAFILNKVDSCQIVLLGEHRHHQHIYYQMVIQFLEYWLELADSGKESPRNIVLILEGSQYFGDKLNLYFHDGDVSRLAFDPQFLLNVSAADLEFYHDLKLLFERIEELNNGKKKAELLDFKVACIEKYISTLVSREVRDEYFRTERDIYAALKIEEMIRQLPDHKFLGIFGGNHVMKKRDPKNNIPRLAEQLIERGIKTYSIYRSLLSENRFRIAYTRKQKDFLLPLEVIDEFELAFSSDMVDAWIFYNEAYFDDIVVKNIPSVNLVQNAIDYAKQYPNTHSTPLIWLWYRITGEMIPRTENVIDYIEKRLHIVNTIEIVDNMALFENLFRTFERAKVPAPEIMKIMANLTGHPPYDETFFKQDDSNAIDYWKEFISDNRDRIKARLLTSILYYGTETEQSRAMEKLEQLARKGFKTKKEWLSWYRRSEH
ncbi:MAG: hypothetical protein JSV33_05760 [bacterium]|nr:MAG: hypothetical protein JSV33_05760 [bacterium]